MKKDVVLIDGARTGIGAFDGSLRDMEVTDLVAIVIEEALNLSLIHICSFWHPKKECRKNLYRRKRGTNQMSKRCNCK